MTPAEFVFELLIEPTNRRLEEIGRFRAEVWRHEFPTLHTPDGLYLDDYEHLAMHWLVSLGGELVAAARMSIHESLDVVPNPTAFSGLDVTAPIASLNRLVVHPSVRGRGLARRLDRARLDYATELGARSAIGLAFPWRVAALELLGFRHVAAVPTPAWYVERGVTAPELHVMVLRIGEQGQGTAE